jgi:type IV secretion system protein VirB6
MAVGEVGNGIGASLRGVDCLAAEMTASAFGRLFGSGGALVPALTILLTLFVAFFAFALITGRTRIGIRSLTPRMVTLGLVVTFATSWFAYQSVVWNLATGAPDQIASIISGTQGSATQVFGDKIDIVFAAIQQATGEQDGQQQQQQAVSTFSPEGLMWMGATLLLLGTVGVLVTARIALAVLVAVGPVFVVMALFPATRGLFAGWIRGLAMLAVTPLFAVLGGTLMLELAVPVLSALAPIPGEIDARAAMAFFMIGAVHVALMVLTLKVAATMVGNWTVFGLIGESGRDARNAPASGGDTRATIATHTQPASGGAAPAPSRRIAISGFAAGIAANDANPGSVTHRETRILGSTNTVRAQSSSSTTSRARGIGSRFRAAPARQTEKFK